MRIVEIGKKNLESIEKIGKPGEAGTSSQQLAAPMSASDEWLLATQGRTFHFAAHFLSPKHRPQVVTLYAFFRTLDDLVDQPVGSRPVENLRIELHAWKRWFTEGHSFPAPREPMGTRLAAILDKYPLPTTIFLDFLDGLASDLEPREIRNFRELHHYCYCVAGTVGLALAYILGTNSAHALDAAQSLGIGMQLTNILRDVGSDLAVERIYLPREDLERFGSSRMHLSQLLKKQYGPDDRFRALMSYQIARAHRYYVRGMSGIWLLPPGCRLSILVAARLYRRILTEIEHRNYDVLRSRAATSFPEKVQEAAIAFTLDRLWQRGEFSPDTEAEVLFED